MTSSGQVAIACGVAMLAAGVLALSAYEVWQFSRSRILISLRQLIIRLIGGLLLVFMLGKVLHGVLAFEAGESIRSSLIFWGDVVLIGWLTILVAAIDLRYCMKLRQRHRQYNEEMAEHLMSQVNSPRERHDARDGSPESERCL